MAAFYHEEAREKLRKIMGERPNGKFLIYGPTENEREFDGSILLIYCMATFTVGLGSLWSGYTKYYL